jgi:hypothetical protein
MRRWIYDIVHNASTGKVAFMMTTNPSEGTVIVSYLIPVAVAMAGVEGTPEEVVEWLQTGLGPDQRVTLSDTQSGQAFAITQTHREQYVLDDINELVQKWNLHLAKKPHS